MTHETDNNPMMATLVDAYRVEQLRHLLAWCYGKLHYRSFDSLDDALKLDEIKLLLEHDV